MNASLSPLKAALRGAGLTLMVLAVSGCVTIYRNHGYVPTPEDLDAIQVGKDTRDSVVEAVGPPTSSGVLKDSGFYYVASRMRHFGPTEPKVVSREVVAINFDQRGVVRGIERYGLEDGRTIPLERRVTSSSVEDKTFLRQLLGNLGRFNPGSVLE
ncbi:outer membrane protein assembly factor BamE [Aquicoccus sp. SU-CL01552]|uniref:outer membrane protein assembly factor BamE n=1 Tax=Aquicoccus sp. SU-CL01552 TaxID=3127656 RepID=UPI003104EA7A